MKREPLIFSGSKRYSPTGADREVDIAQILSRPPGSAYWNWMAMASLNP